MNNFIYITFFVKLFPMDPFQEYNYLRVITQKGNNSEHNPNKKKQF